MATCAAMLHSWLKYPKKMQFREESPLFDFLNRADAGREVAC